MAFLSVLKNAVNNVITGSLRIDNCSPHVVEISLTNAGLTYATQTIRPKSQFTFEDVTRVFYSLNVIYDDKLQTYRVNCFADGRLFEIHWIPDRRVDNGFCIIAPYLENQRLKSNQIKLICDPRRPGLKWRGDVITQYDVNYREQFAQVLSNLKILRFEYIQGEHTLQLSSRKIKDIFLNLRNKLVIELILMSGFLVNDRVLVDIRSGPLTGLYLDGRIESQDKDGAFNVRIDDTIRARRCMVENALIPHVTSDRLRLWKRRNTVNPEVQQHASSTQIPYSTSSVPPSPVKEGSANISELSDFHSSSEPLFDISVSHTSPAKQPNVRDTPAYELHLDTSNKFTNLKSNIRYDSALNDLTRELMNELSLDDRRLARKFISSCKGDLDLCRERYEECGENLQSVFEKTHFVQLVFPYQPLGFRFSVDLSCHYPYVTFVNVVHEYAAHIEVEWDIISINGTSLQKATQKQVQSLLDTAEMPLKIVFLKNFRPPPPPELVAEWERLNESFKDKYRKDLQDLQNLETDVDRLLQSEEAAMRNRTSKTPLSLEGAAAFLSEDGLANDSRMPECIMSDQEIADSPKRTPRLNRATSLLGIREMAVADARHFEYPTRQAVFRLHATGLNLENLVAAKFLEYEVHYVQSCLQATSVAVGDQIDVSELALPPGWCEHQIPGSCKIVYRHEDGRISLDHPSTELWIMLADSSNEDLPYAYPSVGF